MTTEERLDNPDHNYKPEIYHVEHTIERLKERYGIEMDINEYYNFLELVQKKADDLYSLNCSTSVKRVMYKGQLIWLIFSRKAAKWVLPARIKTILHKNFIAYPVPDRFGLKIPGEMLANDVRAIIEEVKTFRTNVMPHITKKELFVEPDFDGLSKIFKSISEKLHHGKLTEDDLYRGAFKIAFEKYDKSIFQNSNSLHCNNPSN